MYQVKTRRSKILSLLSKIIIIAVIMNLLASAAFGAESITEEARRIIENYYLYEVPENFNGNSVEDMVESLNDPYSVYFSPEEYKAFTGRLDNKFFGIGVSAGAHEEGLEVLTVFKDSPAEEAGIKEGDIIVKVDDILLKGMSLDEAISYVRGEEGTTARIRVKRGDSYITYEVVRGEITDSTVEGAMLTDDTGYIGISSFGDNTVKEFDGILKELRKANAKKFIVDLRYNGGGYVTTAVDLAGYFVGDKESLVIRDKNGVETRYKASEDVDVIEEPVILLVNEYSASASEMLAAALKDYDRAFIVGSSTYGKGVSQSIFLLSDGSYLKITSDEFFSPLGNKIHGVGVIPHLDVGEEDPLMTAMLLLSESNSSTDKSGFVKVSLEGWDFEINLEEARLPEYWGAYRNIVESLDRGSIKIGGSRGWAEADEDIKENLWKSYYPRYRETDELKDVALDKEFTIKFSKGVDAESIGEDTIELINAQTGERTYLFKNFHGSKTIKAIPHGGMQPGSKYYVVIHDTIKGSGGERLKEGTVTEVWCENPQY